MQNQHSNSGVYAIEHIPTGRFYIGSSKTLAARLRVHRWALRTNSHPNQKLQRSWNVHVEEEFRFFVLDTCHPDERIALEQKYIDDLQPYYNIALVAGCTEGVKMTVHSRMKLAKSKGLVTVGETPETFKTLSDIAAEHGMDPQKLWRRVVKQGMSIEHALALQDEEVFSSRVKTGWSNATPESRRQRSESISNALRGKERPARRKFHEFRGEMITLHELADRFQIPFERLRQRVYGGVDLETAVRCGNLEHLLNDPERREAFVEVVRNNVANRKTPVMSAKGRQRQREAVIQYNRARKLSEDTRRKMSERKKQAASVERFEYMGEQLSVFELSQRYGIDRHSLRKRLNAGWSVEEAVTKPVTKKPRKNREHNQVQAA